MSSQSKALLVFGSGPGIGLSTATTFAKKGFNHIILLSRNAQRLENDKETVLAAAHGARVDTIQVDLSDRTAIDKATRQIDQLKPNVEVVFYNAARVAELTLLETPVEDLQLDLQVTTTGLYTVAQWAIPQLLALHKADARAKPTLLVTTGELHKRPQAKVFSLTVSKAAQHSLVECLHQVYQPQGVHIGMVLVGGAVAPEMKVLNPENIGKETWKLYEYETRRLEIEMWEP